MEKQQRDDGSSSLSPDRGERGVSPPTPRLLERFRDGDDEGYAVLFRRYRRPLERFIHAHASRSLLARTSVDDLLQETHLDALGLVDRFTYRRELSFFFWLCEIARRRILGHARAHGRRPTLVSLRLPRASASSSDLVGQLRGPSEDHDARLDALDELHLVAVAMQRLPARRRRAIVLRHVEGFSSAEAARRLGVTVGNLRVLLARGLVQLRNVLDDLRAGGTAAARSV